MIFDYYNIVCENCNSRLLNRKNALFDAYLVNCNCGEVSFSSRKGLPSFEIQAYFVYHITNGLIKASNVGTGFSLLHDMPYTLASKAYGNIIQINSIKDKIYHIHKTLKSLFNDDEIFELINKPYLSEIYFNLIKIIETYNNNLIFQ